jgi:hypothetical protein
MMIGARTATWTKSGETYTAESYSELVGSDHLWMHHDAIENVGYGLPHSSTAAKWTDLSGVTDTWWSNVSSMWGSDYLLSNVSFSSGMGYGASPKLNESGVWTWTGLMKISTGGIRNTAINTFDIVGSQNFSVCNKSFNAGLTLGEDVSFAVVCDSENGIAKLFIDGILKSSVSISGSRPTSGNSFVVYSGVKVYRQTIVDFVMSELQIKKFYEMDKARFGLT